MELKKSCSCFIFTVLISWSLVICNKSHTDVILFGALGDLSKRYLWQSFFQLFLQQSNENTTFSFYGISRDAQEEGFARLSRIVKEEVTCKDTTLSSCPIKLTEFQKIVTYFQLKTDVHFHNFGIFLSKPDRIPKDAHLNGRIFYLALPASAFAGVAEKVSGCCKISSDNSWSRIVLEKPFGSDMDSAAAMVKEIEKYFTEEEIYRVDHYLAKSVAKQILPFRSENKDRLEHLLNNEHVERIEIVMKETLDIKGRVAYYDKYGVVRDVMQNHLTELLALVTMNLPKDVYNDKEAERQKLDLLKDVLEVKESQLLIGQYLNYLRHAKEEDGNVSTSAFTPTFAAAYLQIDSHRWHGVPIILMSGKALDERSSYVRILFKDNSICVCGCHSSNVSQHSPKQIVFQINSQGHLPSPGILVSKNLFTPSMNSGLKTITLTSQESFVFGQSLNEFYFAVPKLNNNAYVTVVEDLYYGDKKSFVNKERLLKLWTIWTPVLEKTRNVLPKIYIENNDNSLNFYYKDETLKFSTPSSRIQVSVKTSVATLPSLFLGHKLVVESDEKLYLSLAERLYQLAIDSVSSKNVFHIALSGGSSLLTLYKTLNKIFPKFPWRWTHIWQVDERCVNPWDSQSNFKTIDAELLQNIHVPYFNIHAMPVYKAGILCDKESASIYESEISYHIPNHVFDVILLGVGQDGHTASLFPRSQLLYSTDKVAMTSKLASPQRMTLLYPVLNKAKNIAVIISGVHKHEIIDKLSEENTDMFLYPILGIIPNNGNLTFYVDNAAWYGK